MDDVASLETIEAPETSGAELEVPEGPSEIPPVEAPEAEPGERPERREKESGPLELKEVKQALARLRETNPKEADALRKAYFSFNDLSKHFPSVREAQAAKIALDTVGGVEGIATLREQVQASEYLEQAAEAGDSSIIDDWAKDYPQGFRQVMPHAIRQYSQMDPQGFSKEIQPHLFEFLDRSQLADRLSEAFDAIGNNNTQAAQTLLRNIYQWIGAQKQFSEQSRQQQQNPQADRLSDRENQLVQKEDALFRGEIGRDTYGYQQSQVKKALAPYLRGAKISEQAKNRLMSTVNQDVFDNLTADDGYQRQVKAFLARKDGKGTATYIKAHLDSVIPEIAKRAWSDLYGSPSKAAKAATLNTTNGGKPTIGSAIWLAKKPNAAEIEKRPGWMEGYISGRAIMSSGPYKGKMVRWKKA